MRRILPLLAFLVATLSLGAAAIPFPQASSDLKADSETRFGTLPNGLRYALRANKEPKERASLRLLVEAGAVHEKDEQQGLAHFLEHMAFNGSTHYPDEDTLIKFFQRMGMNFGGDTNASTWYTRTLYLLELPDTKPATLTEGLKVFQDYAGGLLLKTDEIDKERGIILSEKRSRDSVGYRTSVATRNFLLGGTVFEKRDVIGTNEVLTKAGREQFVDFYETWYRPEAMALVLVGDMDVAAVEKQIIEAFSPLKAKAAARPQPDWGKVPARSGTTAFYHYESEAPSTSVTIATIVPYQKEPDTGANRLKHLPRSIAHAMLNRRLSILAKKENAPFTGGSASVGEGYNFYRQGAIALNCRADQWTEALGVADQELRRAIEHGFQKAELQEVVANFRNSLEQAVKTAATRRSDGMADEIVDTLLERDVWTSPADDLALYGPALDKITVEQCHAAMRESWSPSHRLIMVTGNAKIGSAATLPGAAANAMAAVAPNAPAPGSASSAAERAILGAYEKSRTVAVTPPETIADIKWAYTDFGATGKVAKREHVQDLDVTLITFENGVRLNLKRTEFEQNRIRISTRVGHGALTEPHDKPGLVYYANQTYSDGGLGKHSVDDLRRILAGKTVGGGFGAGADAFSFSGGTNREDLLLQMQLIAARITDPGYRPEAARQALKGIEQLYLSFEHTASGPFTLEISKLLASGDHRFGLPPKTELLKRTPEEVRAWVTPDLASGPIEIGIVGDLDIDQTIDAVAKTLGALPKRQERKPLDDLRRVKFPATPFSRDYAIPTEIPNGQVALYWATTDGREVRRARRLSLLSEVFSDRLRIKVREEMGDAYSPGAGSSASDVYPGYGYIQAGTIIDPPRAKQVADMMVTIATELAEKGTNDDELLRAKQPILTSLRESARTNPYWLGNVVGRAQERPEMLDWCRSRYADFEAISVAEINALAKEYLGAGRASRVIIIPQAKDGPAPAAKKAE